MCWETNVVVIFVLKRTFWSRFWFLKNKCWRFFQSVWVWAQFFHGFTIIVWNSFVFWGKEKEFNYQAIPFKLWWNDSFVFCQVFSARISHKKLPLQQFSYPKQEHGLCNIPCFGVVRDPDQCKDPWTNVCDFWSM